MDTTRRGAMGAALAATLFSGTAQAHPAPSQTSALRPVKVPPPGAFTADWSSFTTGYSAPDWFRDAKFGIWAHWGAASVPAAGDDWYARDMYLQGHPSYDHHHAWNSTRVGPKKDIIGIWSKLARERGLRFAVSNHSGHAWHWNQAAYGYDAEGSRQGQRYDAARLTSADGAGKWWEGLDPQQLYTGNSMAMPDGISSIAEANAWHAATDGLWTEGTPPSGGFVQRWALRCRELVDKYRPDMLYFDNHDLPLQQAGLDMAAYFYNRNMEWNDGRLEAVVTAKETAPQRRMGLVDVVERGGKGYIEQFPWQTETCLGNWFYGEQYYREDRYKTPAKVIRTLCDVVSKNGNLMLSVPIRGDGTIDDKEERIVERIADWMGRNGEAIYGSRPWRIHGEGPTGSGSGGAFSEGGNTSPYGARDIRYVTKAGNLHALVLGWPEDGIARLSLLGAANPIGRGQVQRVTLASDSTPLAFKRTDTALEVTLPEAARDDIGLALIISGEGLAKT